MAPLVPPTHEHCTSQDSHCPHLWSAIFDGNNSPYRWCCGARPVSRDCPSYGLTASHGR